MPHTVNPRRTLDLLHVLHHRNKNQHRRSAWWKWFSLLRRNLAHLLRDDQRKARVAMEAYLRTHLIPRCYVAFSSLVADTQFAGLGLTLLAVLADVAKLVGFMGPKGPEESEKAEDEEGDEEVGEDEGEVVARDQTPHGQTEPRRVRPTGDKKEAKTSASEIDDLFSGLV